MTFLFTESAFNEARKSLALATRVDAMHCLSAVRRLVSDMLTSLCVDPAVTRLAMSDIAETLLAREARRIADLASYQEAPRVADREQLLEVVLTSFLFDWLLERTANTTQQALVFQGAQHYANWLTSARPS